MIHVAPNIIEPSESITFLVLIYIFSATPRHFPKYMVLAAWVSPPPFIVSIDNDKNDLETLSNGANSIEGAAHYNPIEN